MIAVDAPTDLAALDEGYIRSAAERSFPDLRAASPLFQAPRILAPTLLAHAIHDDVIPFAHTRALAPLLQNGRVVALRPGTIQHVHRPLAAADLQRQHRAERRLLASVATRG